MPILKNAKKALRVSKRKNVVNRRVKTQMKSAIDAFEAKPSKDALSTLFSRVDRAVKKNLVHRNKAARMKAQAHKTLANAK